MKFYISFNREEQASEDGIDQGAFFSDLGCIWEADGLWDVGYFVEINNLEELAELEKKIYNLTRKYYSIIISFDMPGGGTIYLDKNI